MQDAGAAITNDTFTSVFLKKNVKSLLISIIFWNLVLFNKGTHQYNVMKFLYHYVSEKLVFVPCIYRHRGKTDVKPIMSRTKNVLNGFFVCYQEHSEYLGVLNMWRGFHGEPAHKKHYKNNIWTSTSSSATTWHLIRKCIFIWNIAMSIIFKIAPWEPV